MRATKEASNTANPAGSPKVTDTTPQNYKRRDFFRDLKKVTKKQNQPSQRDSEKR